MVLPYKSEGILGVGMHEGGSWAGVFAVALGNFFPEFRGIPNKKDAMNYLTTVLPSAFPPPLTQYNKTYQAS